MSVASAAVLAIGAGTAAYGASQAGKGSGQSRDLGGEFSGMPFGMYQDQLGALADQQMELYQDTARLNLELYPEFAAAQRAAQRQSALQMLRMYPQFTAAERLETSRQRGADLRDLGQYGAGYASVLSSLSPSYASLDAAATTDAPNREILDRLHTQALGELDRGGALSPDELRAVTQGARVAAVDRGLEFSNPAMVEEVLARQGAVRGRINEGRTFASGVQNLEEAASGNRVNRLLAASQVKLNPFLAAMTRTGVSPTIAAGPAQLAPSAGLPAQVFGAAPQAGQMAGALGPLYNYASDVYNTNFNTAEGRAVSQANALTAMGGGLMSFGGSLYGGGGGAARPRVGGGIYR